MTVGFDETEVIADKHVLNIDYFAIIYNNDIDIMLPIIEIALMAL